MSIAEIRQLPKIEKLKLFEQLWADLSERSEDFESPAWHGEELRKTEASFNAGEIKAIDWEEAKKRADSAKPVTNQSPRAERSP
jgi:hypothetical protein